MSYFAMMTSSQPRAKGHIQRPNYSDLIRLLQNRLILAKLFIFFIINFALITPLSN